VKAARVPVGNMLLTGFATAKQIDALLHDGDAQWELEGEEVMCDHDEWQMGLQRVRWESSVFEDHAIVYKKEAVLAACDSVPF
jgi:hypothetical protein